MTPTPKTCLSRLKAARLRALALRAVWHRDPEAFARLMRQAGEAGRRTDG